MPPIGNDLSIKVVIREAIEIRLKISNNNIFLNRDLLEESAPIGNDLSIKQVVREALEKINNNNIFLNRDLGEYSLNALYTSLI